MVSSPSWTGARKHADCVAAPDAWTGPVVTTEAVLTETLYLLGPQGPPQRIYLEFFLRGAFALAPSSRANLARVAALMEQYQEVPMDFADGTLVALAEELGTDQVLTLDRRGFSTYRLHGRKVLLRAPLVEREPWDGSSLDLGQTQAPPGCVESESLLHCLRLRPAVPRALRPPVLCQR